MPAQESVLCIVKKSLPESWTQPISVVPVSKKTFVEKCSAADYRFVNRAQAETDPSKKQIIPYIILQTSDYRHTAKYLRKGSEKRLHDLWSIGIGGHINPIDSLADSPSFEQALEAGMTRELNEELIARPEGDSPVFMGIISEDETDVGKVHFGAVFRILTNSPEKYVAGSELSQFSWEQTENLTSLNLELWSSLSLRLLAD